MKSGQTCPDELRALIRRRGARVFSIGNLHAKVFVTENRVFVGSANVSRNAAEHLMEAVAVSESRRLIAAARRYINGLCLEELGPDELLRLSKLYVPPTEFPGAWRQPAMRRGSVKARLGRLVVAQLTIADPPIGSGTASSLGGG